MDGNDFFLEILVRQRLAEARAEMARHRLARGGTPRPSRLARLVARAWGGLRGRRAGAPRPSPLALPRR